MVLQTGRKKLRHLLGTANRDVRYERPFLFGHGHPCQSLVDSGSQACQSFVLSGIDSQPQDMGVTIALKLV